MTNEEIQQAAIALRSAAATGEYIAPLHQTWSDMTIEHAYAIQHQNTQWKISQGRSTIGCKIGLTSVAVQRQLGVNQPDFGMLFDDMCYGDGQPIPASILTQPKIEAEIAFVIGSDIDQENPTQIDVLNSIAYALPALEIVGSRIANWNISITDTIADNASSSAFVLGGTPVQLDNLDLRLCGMVMERKGEPVSVGAGAACLGHPINAVTWLAQTMTRLGHPLRAGTIVLSGALGPMVAVSPGDAIEARINGIGSVRAFFEQTDAEVA